jgi:NAD(P)-dependent dehydrogenase (short-subunit alcohol dehydrogenase family)
MGERLKGKVAIVTGAGAIGPGIGNGKATAIVFAREGARVMLVDLNLKAAEETKSIIDKEGGTTMVFQADVSKSADCKKMVDTCIKTWGRLDVLHNNVGIGQWGGVVTTPEEEFDKVMTVNVKSMFLTCKYAVPQMVKQGNGSIINIASVGAIRTTLPCVAYGTSKAAVLGFTREVAVEFASKGIRCNAILPGLMKTPQAEYYNKATFAGGDVELMWKRRDAMSPTGKQGEGWDVANAALFLASDESKYVNGMHLLVDGGIALTTRTFS